MADPESPWLTTEEAAKYLKYSAQAIRAACRDDRLRHVQPGGTRGKILVRREWLDVWMEQFVHGGE